MLSLICGQIKCLTTCLPGAGLKYADVKDGTSIKRSNTVEEETSAQLSQPKHKQRESVWHNQEAHEESRHSVKQLSKNAPKLISSLISLWSCSIMILAFQKKI